LAGTSKNSSKTVETPLMKQYNAIKGKHPDAILLFRVGDFYETFSEDAIKASEILGITLTKRKNGAASFVELAGFPYHALDTYLPKLVRAGLRVAVCDQLEDPKTTKKVVKRGITELVTPGVSYNENILEQKENHFLASLHIEKNTAGIAFLDISTGEFMVAEGNFEYIDKLLNNFQPKEVIFERGKEQRFTELFGTKFYTYTLDEWVFTMQNSREKLLNHFNTNSLKGFGIENLDNAVISAGAAIQYLEHTQHEKIQHISGISCIEQDHYVWLDKFTIRNLEIFYSINEGAKTLIDVIDKTNSPMGARLLRRWTALPLKELKPVSERLDAVEYLIGHDDTREEIKEHLKSAGDPERLISKLASNRITPRELVQLKIALSVIEPIKKLCLDSPDALLKKIGDQLSLCKSARERIENEIKPDPPNQVNKGNVIASEVSKELDELRHISHSGKDYIAGIQQKESTATGIPSLKIGYNNVFGYYIEVTNTHKDKVPDNWIRKQTLVNAERYITEELKVYEEKILGAEEKIVALETNLFHDLIMSLVDYIEAIQLNASLLAKLDCLVSFAQLAKENHYVKPVVNDDDVLEIKDGRHPVIEQQLPLDEKYIANDVLLDNREQQIIIITGPNMSGKSALLRQTALIVLLAQMGCYVPASSANIGLVDKIFTRVGASDNISLGESTFMVEMNEAASILNNITPRSLILLDEIGRGTSTYDGISIAWAIVEYIHEHPKASAKTLFATHYHELNEMEQFFNKIKNYNVTVKELEDKVIFLRKFKRGGSEHSFGIHVARMAGMPKSVVKRSEEILKELEGKGSEKQIARPVTDISQNREGMQLSFFQLDDPVLKQIRDEIKNININELTPVDALNKLNDIKKWIGIK